MDPQRLSDFRLWRSAGTCRVVQSGRGTGEADGNPSRFGMGEGADPAPIRRRLCRDRNPGAAVALAGVVLPLSGRDDRPIRDAVEREHRVDPEARSRSAKPVGISFLGDRLWPVASENEASNAPSAPLGRPVAARRGRHDRRYGVDYPSYLQVDPIRQPGSDHTLTRSGIARIAPLSGNTAVSSRAGARPRWSRSTPFSTARISVAARRSRSSSSRSRPVQSPAILPPRTAPPRTSITEAVP